MEKVTVLTVCPICGEYNFVDNVPLDGYNDWLNGELIQNAMPDLSPEEREMLISGVCPECWQKMMGGE